MQPLATFTCDMFAVPINPGGTVYYVYSTTYNTPSVTITIASAAPIPVYISVTNSNPSPYDNDYKDLSQRCGFMDLLYFVFFPVVNL